MQIHFLTHDNWETHSGIVQQLVRAYAMQFWSGAWKELLVIRDDSGQVLKQFGTFDKDGVIYPETLELLRRVGLNEQSPEWPEQLWELAASGELSGMEGECIHPFWSLEQAEEVLRSFVNPVDQDGYGGELVVLTSGQSIVGFTAFTCLLGEAGRMAAQKRYPVTSLYLPIESREPVSITLSELLVQKFGEHVILGIYLDHAISERYRGQRLGSCLFDVRINRMIELGTDVFVGRTILTSVQQYRGNYVARGMRPVAADGTDTFSRNKHYFFARASEIRPRKHSFLTEEGTVEVLASTT